MSKLFGLDWKKKISVRRFSDFINVMDAEASYEKWSTRKNKNLNNMR